MPNRLPTIARAFALASAKSLGVSALIVLPGLAIMLLSPVAGTAWMLVGSFGQVAWGYRREWRVVWITAVLPPIAAGVVWLVQTLVLDIRLEPLWLGPVLIVGGVLGLLRGLTHRLRVDRKGIYARRTVLYLAAWLACTACTQAFAFARQQELTGLGHLAGAFSASVLAGVSLVVLARYVAKRGELVRLRAHTQEVPA